MNLFERAKMWFAEHKRDAVLAVLIFLIATLSFGLGYLYAMETNRTPIVIEKATSQ